MIAGNSKAELWISAPDFVFLHFIKVELGFLNNDLCGIEISFLITSRSDLDLNFIDQFQIHV